VDSLPFQVALERRDAFVGFPFSYCIRWGRDASRTMSSAAASEADGGDHETQRDPPTHYPGTIDRPGRAGMPATRWHPADTPHTRPYKRWPHEATRDD
jgi:hypothetical protein